MGIGYSDGTGSFQLDVPELGLFLLADRAGRPERAPTRRSFARLAGPGASAVVEELLSLERKTGIRDLVARVGVDPATVSRTVIGLDDDGLVDRSAPVRCSTSIGRACSGGGRRITGCSPGAASPSTYHGPRVSSTGWCGRLTHRPRSRHRSRCEPGFPRPCCRSPNCPRWLRTRPTARRWAARFAPDRSASRGRHWYSCQ